MSETKDKAELLIIANLAEQAERYDGKYGLRFQCFFRAFACAHIQSGNTNYIRQIVGFSGTYYPIRKQGELSRASYDHFTPLGVKYVIFLDILLKLINDSSS